MIENIIVPIGDTELHISGFKFAIENGLGIS